MSEVARFLTELKAWLAGLPPDSLPWLERFLSRSLDFFFAPLVERGGRFPWPALVAALVIALIVFLLSRKENPDRRLSGFFRFCFPKGLYTHACTWADWQIAFANHFLASSFNLTWRINTALLAGGLTTLLTFAFGPPAHPFEWTAGTIFAFTLLMSLASDLGYYLFHWTSHMVPALWAFHKVHHSAEVMTPLTAARVHPMERAVLGPFRAVTTSLIVAPALYLFMGETSTTTVFGLELFALLFNSLGHVLHHSHIWVYYGPVIGRIIISPAQHQIHHSVAPQHWNRNFAEHWAIWDTLFGTLYLPKEREHLTYGLAGVAKQPHPNVVAAYVVPYWEAAYTVLAPLGSVLRPLGRRLSEQLKG